MHELAAYSMRGPKQAAIVATIAAAIPLMYWLSAAVLALVVLRHGLGRGIALALWPALPAAGWAIAAGDPSALLSLPAALLMALVLRSSIQWPLTLFVGALFYWVLAWVTPTLMPGLYAFLLEFSAALMQAMQDAGSLQVEAEAALLREAFESLVLASFAGGLFVMSVLSLFLARSWQSRLFNPGGWQQEFHSLRLQPKHLVVIAALLVLASVLKVELSAAIVLLLVVLMTLGFAMMHGLVAKKGLGLNWLIALYVVIIALMPTSLLLMALLALLDTLVNFRGKSDLSQKQQ